MSFDPSALAEPPRRDPGPARRPEAGPHDQRPRRADLRHDHLRLRRRRARRAPVRAPGVREHLHPDHEPDHRRVRGARRGARGRRRGPRARVRPGGRDAVDPQPRAARATTSSRSSSLYGGTYNLFHYTLPKLGITVKFVDGLDPASFGPAIDERTKAVFLETIGNPRLDVPDIRAIADVAHAKGVPVIVDNTFAPLLAKPDRARRRHRHPLGDEVDRRPRDGDRRRRRRRRQVRLGGIGPRSRSSPTRIRRYHGVVYSEAFGNARVHPQAPRAGAARHRRRRSARSTRSCSSRASRRCRCGSSATARTRWRSPSWLEDRPEVEWVSYPGLKSHPAHETADALPQGRLRRRR